MPTRAELITALSREGTFQIIESTDAHGLPTRVYSHAPRSLRAVLEATRAWGDRPFLTYEDETLSFRDHWRRVAALAHHLRASGIAKGDRVAIGMRNYPEWVVSFWACQAIGAVTVALNAWWTGPELVFALQDSGASALLLDGERLERLGPELARLAPKTLVVARAGDRPGQGLSFTAVTAGEADELPEAEIGPEDFATILYTSGTTGRPKGAVATHANHVTNLWNSLLGVEAGRRLAGLAPGAEVPQPRALQTFPFFHIGGMTGLYVNTALGAQLVVMYRWSAIEAVKLIERHKLTSAGGVPMVVRQLLEAAAEFGGDLSTLQGLTSGGASVPPDLIRRIGSDFDAKVAPGNGYGLTETTSAVISNSGAEYLAHPDSIGRPMPTADIRVVDDGGRDVPDGAVGELWAHGPNIIPGYWDNPDATEAAFGGGWFRTGDLGYRDPSGLYYVVDRKKDVVIRGGENVYCAEVESAMIEHPLVLDVAVLGVPHREWGEEVAAVVQVAADGDGDPTPEIVAHVAGKLARFKVPTTVRLTTEELPRTATGKILKRELRRLFEA
ncbi:class I adenylate-forming enzyme family protein [Chelatococcus reniformis]|uniref:Fatty acid--CoA ligase n=1 Tax=Chelatococcus reniformis TaxID=1494448 RepID=A0A916URM0_9HYPH|nr:class I adenylate-forming enzyme family protein [Chelatococcus reniformis]GGC84942.1 fatty acid--CoA ligase [Chelatococcus reniformis]